MASLRWLCSICFLIAMAPVSGAGAPEAGFSDLWQTVQACKRLQEDEVLAPLNIGVKVRGRIAILWGPIASPELAIRAEARLRAMIELVDVRNELIVVPEDLSELPVLPTPLYLPEKAPPPLRDLPRPFSRLQRHAPAQMEIGGAVWLATNLLNTASAKR